MDQKLIITKSTSPEEISEYIKILREQKGKENETLKVIEEALIYGNDFIINLYFEEALTYQHFYMNDNSNKKAISDMEKSILKAEFHIEKYKLIRWNSRLYRFLGRISDYKGKYKLSIDNYKRAIKFVKFDSEPHRKFELEAFLSFSLIMSGKYNEGYKMARKIYQKFTNSKEGLDLKKKDYQTWGIWMSGLVIRTVEAFIEKKFYFKINEVNSWLKEVEKYINNKELFSYRITELNNLWTRLKNYKNS